MNIWVRRVLLDWPALIVTVWYRIYAVTLALVGIATVSMCVVMMTLYALGIRWGW